MSERLDRIEALIEANSQAIANAATERQELREVFLSTMRVVSESAQTQSEMLKSIAEMQAEVRGLQVENRRILDHLFGES